MKSKLFKVLTLITLLTVASSGFAGDVIEEACGTVTNIGALGLLPEYKLCHKAAVNPVAQADIDIQRLIEEGAAKLAKEQAPALARKIIADQQSAIEKKAIDAAKAKAEALANRSWGQYFKDMANEYGPKIMSGISSIACTANAVNRFNMAGREQQRIIDTQDNSDRTIKLNAALAANSAYETQPSDSYKLTSARIAFNNNMSSNNYNNNRRPPQVYTRTYWKNIGLGALSTLGAGAAFSDNKVLSACAIISALDIIFQDKIHDHNLRPNTLSGDAIVSEENGNTLQAVYCKCCNKYISTSIVNISETVDGDTTSPLDEPILNNNGMLCLACKPNEEKLKYETATRWMLGAGMIITALSKMAK